jgi:hypothetical protein
MEQSCAQCKKVHPVGMNCAVSEVMELKEQVAKLQKEVAQLKAKDQILGPQPNKSNDFYGLPPLCKDCFMFHPYDQRCTPVIPLPCLSSVDYFGWNQFLADVEKSKRDLTL